MSWSFMQTFNAQTFMQISLRKHCDNFSLVCYIIIVKWFDFNGIELNIFWLEVTFSILGGRRFRIYYPFSFRGCLKYIFSEWHHRFFGIFCLVSFSGSHFCTVPTVVVLLCHCILEFVYFQHLFFLMVGKCYRYKLMWTTLY